MNRRIVTALTAACCVVLGLLLPSAAATASVAKASAVRLNARNSLEVRRELRFKLPAVYPLGAVEPHDCFPISGHFIGRYNANPNHWGCATSQEYTFDTGSLQEFTYGEMVWSPNQGTNMVTSAYETSGYGTTSLFYEWGDSTPYWYTDWLIRTYHGSDYTGQRDCQEGVGADSSICNVVEGQSVWSAVPSGMNMFQIEGCDRGTFGMSCKQSWTPLVAVYVQ